MNKEVIDINDSTIKGFVEELRPADPEMRKQVDIGYSYRSKIKVAELFEIRPKWDNPKEIQHLPFARIKHYKAQNFWKLYWLRASGKWDPYEPKPTATNLTEILATIKNDKHGCFFG